MEHEDNCVNITYSHVPSLVPQAFTDSILDPRFREAVTIRCFARGCGWWAL
jgi:hypothetical protein